jgi:hypothetical protein
VQTSSPSLAERNRCSQAALHAGRATVPCEHHASRHRDMRQRQPTCPACIPVTAPAFAGYARGCLVRACPHIGSQPPNHPESLVVIPMRRSRATAFVLNFHKSIDKQHARQKIICPRRQPASLLVHSLSPPSLAPDLATPKNKRLRIEEPAPCCIPSLRPVPQSPD